MEYTTDKEVWFVTGADSVGLAEQKVVESGRCRQDAEGLDLGDLQPTGNRR